MRHIHAQSLAGLRAQLVTFTAHSHLQLPVALCEHSMCCLDGVLYVAGGQTKYSDSGSGATNEVYRFDPWSCRWSRVRYLFFVVGINLYFFKYTYNL